MKEATSRKVLVDAKIENLEDLYAARGGRLDDSRVRRVEGPDARVDGGTYGLPMPMDFVGRWGLEPVQTRISRTVGGDFPIPTYEVVRRTVQGRNCAMEDSGVADHRPVIIGQRPPEAMDSDIFRKGHKLIGKPEHRGQVRVDIFGMIEHLHQP